MRNTQRDISGAPWASPVARETIKKFFRVRRAHEEIQRCNIEVHRLFTSIHNEYRQFAGILETLATQKSAIFGAVNEYCTRRRRVNALLLGQVQRIFGLKGFTGDRALGRRKGGQDSLGDEQESGDGFVDDDGGGDGGDVDDVEKDQLNGIIDFVANL